MEVVDALEMVEVEQEQHAGALRLERFAEHLHQLAAVGEAGHRVGVGVALGLALGAVISFERDLQILRAAPAEQDQRDVEQQGDDERAVGRGAAFEIILQRLGKHGAAGANEQQDRGNADRAFVGYSLTIRPSKRPAVKSWRERRDEFYNHAAACCTS